MAVVSCKEIHVGREGSATSGTNHATTETRKFRIVTNNPYDGPSVARLALDRRGAMHPDNPTLFVKRQHVANEPFSKTVYIGTLEYSDEREQSENPLAVPAEIIWQSEIRQEEAHYDKDGNAILNAAGDYFVNGVDKEVSYWTVKLKKNVAFVPPWIESYRDAINTDSFWLDDRIIAPYAARVAGLSISAKQKQNDIPFRTVELTLKLCNSWIKSVLNQGLRQIIAEGWEPQRCINQDGTDVTSPVLLAADGSQLMNPSPDNAVHLPFHIYPEMQFGGILI